LDWAAGSTWLRLGARLLVKVFEPFHFDGIRLVPPTRAFEGERVSSFQQVNRTHGKAS